MKAVDHHAGLSASFFKKYKSDITHHDRNVLWRKIFIRRISEKDFLYLCKYLAVDRDRQFINGSWSREYNESTLTIAISIATLLRHWKLAANQKDRTWINDGGDLLRIIRLLLEDNSKVSVHDLDDPIKTLDVELVKLLMPYFNYAATNSYPREFHKVFLKNARKELTSNSLFSKSTPVDHAYQEIANMIKNPKKFQKEEKSKGLEYKR